MHFTTLRISGKTPKLTRRTKSNTIVIQMKRNRPVTSFTLPKEVVKKMDELSRKRGLSRSETVSKVITDYLCSPANDLDLSAILRSYWKVRGSIKQSVILAAVGILEKNGKVLIGRRKDKDPYVSELTWVFPGGRLTSLDFEKDVAREVRIETGLRVKVKSLVSARVHPDSGHKSVQVVLLYFHCVPVAGELRLSKELVELKWVKPMQVFRYFTTSVSDEVTRFLSVLE